MRCARYSLSFWSCTISSKADGDFKCFRLYVFIVYVITCHTSEEHICHWRVQDNRRHMWKRKCVTFRSTRIHYQISEVRVVRSLVFCVKCFVICFSFGHCIVCPSIYGFWLCVYCLKSFLTSIMQRKVVRTSLLRVWIKGNNGWAESLFPNLSGYLHSIGYIMVTCVNKNVNPENQK